MVKFKAWIRLSRLEFQACLLFTTFMPVVMGCTIDFDDRAHQSKESEAVESNGFERDGGTNFVHWTSRQPGYEFPIGADT